MPIPIIRKNLKIKKIFSQNHFNKRPFTHKAYTKSLHPQCLGTTSIDWRLKTAEPKKIFHFSTKQSTPSTFFANNSKPSPLLNKTLQRHFCSGTKKVSQNDGVIEATQYAQKLLAQDAALPLPTLMGLSARILAEHGHGRNLTGQITTRVQHPSQDPSRFAMFTQPYGKALEELRPRDFMMIDDQLACIDGSGRKPNMATRFHIHIYKHRPEFQAIIHSHPLYTSALAQTGHPLLVSHMDTMALYGTTGHLKEWPGIPFGDEEGEIISAAFGPDHWAVLLAHHGLVVAGRTLQEATCRAVFFERAAHMQLLSMAAAPAKTVAEMPRVQEDIATRAAQWRASDVASKAQFRSWAAQFVSETELKAWETEE